MTKGLKKGTKVIITNSACCNGHDTGTVGKVTRVCEDNIVVSAKYGGEYMSLHHCRKCVSRASDESRRVTSVDTRGNTTRRKV